MIIVSTISIIILILILIKVEIDYSREKYWWKGIIIPLILFFTLTTYITLVTVPIIDIQQPATQFTSSILTTYIYGQNCNNIIVYSILVQMLKNICIVNIPTLFLLLIYTYQRVKLHYEKS